MQVPGEESTLACLAPTVEMAQEPRPLAGVVTVIGGGNTAMDAARTARRLAGKVIVATAHAGRDAGRPDGDRGAGRRRHPLVERAAPQELVTISRGG
jgi:NADPH-dependent glutamate synthase beta subunit-like oxidoreductase